MNTSRLRHFGGRWKSVSFAGRIFFVLFNWIFALSAFSAESVLKVKLVSSGDDNAKYSIAMLTLGLEKSGKPFELQISSHALTAPKLREELLAGEIDVMWVGTNLDWEQVACPVRVDLFKGLSGHRVLVVHKDNQHLFDQVETLADLRQFTFGQGLGWTDTLILKANGLKVETSTKYDGLFFMVDGKRFDAFPRGVHEPWGEVAKRPELALTVDSNLMLIYPKPYYLMVTPKRPELAEDIERGLLKAIDDGSFDERFLNHPMVKTVIQNANVKSRRIIRLNNPELPPKTPLNNPKLRIDISKL